jgi:membrane associated rhomboid family serine protease
MKRVYPVLGFAGLCWLVYLVNNLILQGRFSHLGIVPRTISGLSGVLLAPLLHASFHHLLANTVPLLILGTIISLRSPATYISITIGGTILSGALTWLLARHGCHIGASGLIFCYFGYVMGHAWFQRSILNILLAFACGFIYGGLIWGLSPFQSGVSWEAHGAGLVAGVFLAWIGHPRTGEIAGGGAALAKPKA